MTQLYTFDFNLYASATVEAVSREEAERILLGVLSDTPFMTIKERPEDSGDEISGECTLTGEVDLVQIDGEDVK